MSTKDRTQDLEAELARARQELDYLRRHLRSLNISPSFEYLKEIYGPYDEGVD